MSIETFCLKLRSFSENEVALYFCLSRGPDIGPLHGQILLSDNSNIALGN